MSVHFGDRDRERTRYSPPVIAVLDKYEHLRGNLVAHALYMIGIIHLMTWLLLIDGFG